MGILYEKTRVRNIITGSEQIELLCKIDTGATLLVIPGWIQQKLEFPLIRKQIVKYANEETAEREVVYGVELEVIGRKGIFEAVVEPKKEYGLIGAVVLESLDFIVEPKTLALYVNPRSPDMPMAEIEEKKPLR